MSTVQDSRDRAAVARILDLSDRPVGTGFLVGPRMVATCAHSVAAAIGGDPHSLLRPYDPVGMDFPWRAPRSRVIARVRGWVPEYADGCGDIAVLELDCAPPAGASPPSMRGTDGVTATGFRMLGVRSSGFGIVAARGDFRAPASGMGAVALEVTHDMRPISDCCSGAPVWDGGANTVIGMATVPDRRSVTRTAHMIPIQDVLRVVSSLQTRGADVGKFRAEPDSAGEPVVGVYGLRTFTVDDGTLRPVFEWGDNTAWRDGTCIAECCKGARHQVPADGCTCGVYSFRDQNHLRRQYPESATIVGVIALEGRVVEGASGWRAQAARLIALWEQVPGVVDVLPGVERYRQVDDMVRAYSGLTVGNSPESTAPRHASPRPAPLRTSLSGPAPRPVLPGPVAASPAPPRYQRSARRAPAGVPEFAIPFLVAAVPLVIFVFAHGPVVALIEIFAMLAVVAATVLVD